MTQLNLKIGTDPELFLSLGDKIISAHNIIPGTKREPYKVEKGAVQVDGIACEFNIDPAEDAVTFDKNIETVLTQVKEIVHLVDKDIKLVFSPIAKLEPEYWKNLPASVKELGCDPDFESKDGSVIQRDIEFLFINPIRTAAGHLHLGFTENEDVGNPVHFEDCRFLANYFSAYNQPYGHGSLTPQEIERYKFYGSKGAFRPKPYGVELRKYSNLWVKNSKTRQETFNFISNNTKSLFRG